jgi:hypothetical protein
MSSKTEGEVWRLEFLLYDEALFRCDGRRWTPIDANVRIDEFGKRRL